MQVWAKPPLRFDVGFGDLVTAYGLFSSNFADSWHGRNRDAMKICQKKRKFYTISSNKSNAFRSVYGSISNFGQDLACTESH